MRNFVSTTLNTARTKYSNIIQTQMNSPSVAPYVNLQNSVFNVFKRFSLEVAKNIIWDTAKSFLIFFTLVALENSFFFITHHLP